MKTIIANGTVVKSSGEEKADILIHNDKIKLIEP